MVDSSFFSPEPEEEPWKRSCWWTAATVGEEREAAETPIRLIAGAAAVAEAALYAVEEVAMDEPIEAAPFMAREASAIEPELLSILEGTERRSILCGLCLCVVPKIVLLDWIYFCLSLSNSTLRCGYPEL